MARGPEDHRGDDDVAPTSYPEITPPRHHLHDVSFTLQAIMELQKSVGELTAKVDRLIADSRSQGDKLDRIRLQLTWVGGAFAVVIAVLVFLPASWREALLGRIFGG